MPNEKKTMTSSTPTVESRPPFEEDRHLHVKDVRELLLWLRKERIVCTEITVGPVHLVVQDMALAAALVPSAGAFVNQESDEEGRRNLYAQYGGAAIDEVAKEEEATYEEDE